MIRWLHYYSRPGIRSASCCPRLRKPLSSSTIHGASALIVPGGGSRSNRYTSISHTPAASTVRTNAANALWFQR
eukprot:COSAG06_NODE_313_length_17764_cov_4.287235_10_plen_74_part_00